MANNNNNFEKTLAIVAKAADGSTAIKLADVQINELMNLNGAASDPLTAYGTAIPAALPVIQGNGASVTYVKNVLANEITGDAVYNDQSNAAKGEPVTIYLNSHLGYQEELTAAEANAQGLGNWLATKLSTYAPQALKKKTRVGFATLVAGAEKLTIAAKATTESERDYAVRILKTLAETAGLMTQASDPKQGIDTFDISQITVSVAPKIMSAIIAAGLQGNLTSEVFAGGVIQKTEWVGLKIQSTPFLPAGTDAFIGTSFIGKSPMITTAMYAGPKNLNGIKYESRAAFLLPGKDKSNTTGFEVMFDTNKPDSAKDAVIGKDFVTRVAVKLA